MSHARRLSGRKIVALAADGFEKVELVIPLRALQLAGATVDVVSLRHGRIRGVNLHMPATRVGVDKVVTEADPDRYDGLLLPGGFINPDLLRQSAEARDFVRAFDHAGKPIATLCHGPWVLASAGLLAGRTLTSWPGIRDDLVNAGATWLDRGVVRDRNLVTSPGPQDIRAFLLATLGIFAESTDRSQTITNHNGSDPQLDKPIGWAVSALRWSPKPSVAALTSVAAAALASPCADWLPSRTREAPQSLHIGRMRCRSVRSRLTKLPSSAVQVLGDQPELRRP
ncbi:type 1 glutamine amidotransferase domain-containing protein [Mycobacterium paraffinicum]|uniref:type 1 glutamine amidotransferase domain-containing protein n=1 Tax=Mycobacterium paraffinicum TaxID=53378 RepID=UPI0009FF11E8